MGPMLLESYWGAAPPKPSFGGFALGDFCGWVGVVVAVVAGCVVNGYVFAAMNM